jgi:uncharacterized membrane protein
VSQRAVTPLRFTLFLWVGSLFALLGLQRLLGDDLSGTLAQLVVLAVQIVPLLVVAPLLLRPGPRGGLWLCLLMPLYFVHGIWQYTLPATRLFGILEVVFSLGAFVSAWLLLKLLPRGSGT